MRKKEERDTTETLRIFFSSPFNGMEKEREELTKFYFPHIHDMCNNRGYQFIPVDLRWGITKESTSKYQTIGICLSEIDRSDIFVGMFGQRYGWNGFQDDLLQKTFDYAQKSYPWLEHYRDRSVTELEFLHGHLNNIGALPACFFFRDKSYDDEQLKICQEKGLTQRMNAFKVESDKTYTMLNDLKRRIKETEDKGAREIYLTLHKYLTEVFFIHRADEDDPVSSILTFHDAFYINRLSLGDKYVGSHDYLNVVNRHAYDEDVPLLVTGRGGSGKSALLANWLKNHQSKQRDKKLVVAYHFVASTAKNAQDVLVILTNIVNQLRKSQKLPLKEHDNAKDASKSLNKILTILSKKEYSVVILVDGLDRVTSRGKSERGMLKLRGKALSPNQMDVVLSQQECKNPLYLKVVLEELSVHGKFETIDDRIKELLSCNDTKELFIKFLERLEMDYNTDSSTNVIKDIMCYLSISKEGLTEKEIIDLTGLESTQLTMIYYATNKYLSHRSVLLKFIYDELNEAIRSIYLHDQSKEDYYYESLINYFSSKLMSISSSQLDITILSRVATELPHLLIKSGRFNELANCICNIHVFQWMAKNGVIDLAEYWIQTKLEPEEINSMLETSIKNELASVYADRYDEFHAPNQAINEIEKVLETVTAFLNRLAQYESEEYFLKWRLRLVKSRFSEDESDSQSEWLADILRNLAILYVDTNRFIEAEPLHLQALNIYESIGSKLQIARSLNGLGLLYFSKMHYDKASEYMLKAIEMHKEQEDSYEYADSINNLACIYMQTDKYTEAETLFCQSLKIYEEYYYGIRNLSMCGSYNNLARCYRNLGMLDKAEFYYKKALDTRLDLIKSNHPDIAESYINMGTFELINKRNYKTAEEFFTKALAIYETVYSGNHIQIAVTCENLALTHMYQSNLGEGVPHFERASKILFALDQMHASLAPLNAGYIEYYLDNQLFDDIKALIKRITHRSLCPDRNFAVLDWINGGMLANQRPPLSLTTLDITFHLCGEKSSKTVAQYIDMLLKIYNSHTKAEIRKYCLQSLDYFEKNFSVQEINVAKVYEILAALYSSSKEENDTLQFLDYIGKAVSIFEAANNWSQANASLYAFTVDYYLNNNLLDQARCLLSKITGTECSSGRDYAALDWLDSQLPKDERTLRPKHQSIDAGLQKHPDNLMLISRKIADFVPDMEKIISMLDDAGDIPSSHFTSVYDVICRDSPSCRQAAIRVLQAGLRKHPDSPDILSILAPTLASYKRYDDAAKYYQKLVTVLSNNPSLEYSYAKVMLLQEKPDLGKIQLEKALQAAQSNNDEAIAAQIQDTINDLVTWMNKK
ncbi:uncharacterized protein TRIADDRAFT_59003 [Trichoplax adhaerens]|uniref:Nephrocystin-3 n=1 Tax=Trichoplax adhaerens TaxID=10228 RepID=B3S494_TRIAD|nr:hypothetical protein TRIADDRAFT_59003 [Trichoplax adhaerens]EDV22418.1 hypothetical protein TRIADDRAFT_59003 [Trichoplax adhaerens]|eukprot:XP_002114962.1 hypothetical protein TRIADDRAFT_59003 [Trichoplax adhaerens]